MSYDQFFQRATANPAPYEYQARLAGGDSGSPCESKLISVPTGLGKTAAVVLSWLWNRVHLRSEKWPRRLVYCLPMRTLVEQTEKEVRKWLGDALWDGQPNTRAGKVGVHILMGGEDAGEWGIDPEAQFFFIETK